MHKTRNLFRAKTAQKGFRVSVFALFLCASCYRIFILQQPLCIELMSRDELAVLDGGKCILQLRGVRPFLSDKYDLTQHPNYKLTSDYDPKNTFDIEKYLNRKEKIQPGDEFFVLDADSLPPI